MRVSVLPRREISEIANPWVMAYRKCEFTVALAIGCITPEREKIVYLLLCGGNKSTQKQDIKKAKALVKSLED